MHVSNTDFDECLEAVANQRDICQANTACVNTIGSFQCVCVPGYELVDGICQRKFSISEQDNVILIISMYHFLDNSRNCGKHYFSTSGPASCPKHRGKQQS